MAPAAMPVAPSAVRSGTFIETKVFTYDLPVEIAPDATITDGPIHIWVERTPTPARDVVAIKVTGHADEEICAAVTETLYDFLADEKNVDGFLHFGVGEMHAAAGATEFQSKAQEVLKGLEVIRAKHADEVKIDDVAFHPAASDAPAGATKRIAILRYRKPSDGPAFIPVRTWNPGGAVEPVAIDATLTDLGMTTAFMSKIEGNGNIAGTNRNIDAFEEQLGQVQRVRAWLSSRKSPVTWPQSVRPLAVVGGTPSVTNLRGWNVAFEAAAMKNDALLVVSEDLSTLASLLAHNLSRRLDYAMRVNEACADNRQRHVPCAEYFRTTSLAPDSTETESLRELSKNQQGLVVKETLLTAELALARAEKADLQARSGTRQGTNDRENIIDGLLRGWMIDIPDRATRYTLIDLQMNGMKDAWHRLIEKWQAHTGADVAEPNSVAGVFQRGNAFFKVQEISKGLYRVSPQYVVIGDYLEIWDAKRRIVTIEVPGVGPASKPDAVDTNDEQEGVSLR